MLNNKVKYLVVDSKDRTAVSPSSSDCFFQLQPAINACTKCELMSFSMPNSQYNITLAKNSVWFFDGANKNCFLPVGNIDLPTLLTALKNSMQALTGFTIN